MAMKNSVSKTKIQTVNDTDHVISQATLAAMGDGQVAYLKPIKSDDIAAMFPGAPEVAPG